MSRIYRRGKIACECRECGKEFLRPYSIAKSAKFCGLSCRSRNYMRTHVQRGDKNPFWRGGKIKGVCLACGKDFESYRKGNGEVQSFCSTVCAHVPRIKEKVSVSCQKCGKAFLISEYRTSKGEGKFCSTACASVSRPERPNMAGENCHWWKGGITDATIKERRSSAMLRWRKRVFERDGYKCYMCGSDKPRINAHHIIPFSESKELRLDIENGVTLCLECHQLFHPKITLADYRKYYGKAYDGPSIYQMAGA